MEVDSWVSVQARRERFEQLYEDSPIVSPQNAPPFHPTPRPRTLSVPYKNSPNCDELRTSRAKNTPIINHESNYKLLKYASNNDSCLGNSEVPFSGKVLKNIKMKEQGIHSGKKDEVSAESNATPISSATKKTSVFKPSSSITNRRDMQDEGAETPTSDTQGKRGRFFSHMRSRSHGNFALKRDSSAETSTTVGQQNGVMGLKENKVHWLTPKYKQRSIDNLLSGEDSKCISSFEGKQKLVSNVVKNMKNKETPTVLRKFSFSSKNEKDVKNKENKEKSLLPNTKHKQSSIFSSVSDKSNNHKSSSRDSGINMDHRLTTEEKTSKTKSHASDIAIVPVLIAKAVAEVASKRCAAQTYDKTGSASSLSSEDRLCDPPARPPRRRAAGLGPNPRRKSKAPSPPSQSSPIAISQNQEIHGDSVYQISSPDASPDITSRRFRDSTDHFKSCESIASCHSPERSFENLHETLHVTSTPVSKCTSSIDSKPRCKSSSGQRHRDDDKKGVFKSEILSVNLKNVKGNSEGKNHQDKNDTSEQKSTTEVEGLPPGPPPKKPPRTFAYDIYKNISMPSLEIESDEGNKKEKTEEKSSPPIYAVPVKKKSNKMTLKPPVRSKSDLSKESNKPSVAPKPPHVLAKAKRASLVDPLSNVEKDEEAAITSEFQRQAHVRYSLRKLNQSSPTSSRDKRENTQDNSHSEHVDSSSEIPYHPDYSTIDYEDDNDLTVDYSRPKRDSSSKVSSSPESGEIKSQLMGKSSLNKDNYHSEYEDIAPITSSSLSTENEQPLSLTYCFANAPLPDVTHLHTKRSMSDETLYKGCKKEEPVYATPSFKTNNYQRDQTSQKELHYMEDADAGRDRAECRIRRNSIQGREISGTEAEDASKGRSSLISAWKREFRQSCRQVQSRIKKTVIR
ncbi:uncharacterized protein LOC123513133 isoform X2 [Portunus trituberculatus]|uniref:uncharacterized protein LOC123513133 isoform X2 n=1 Tax=Portunus trituberculatus TaxID=210409 RepID=UPI001E1CC494|nr:uncharacterized protein LOC123513133 isoform X2 [Portunus trituberculatus]